MRGNVHLILDLSREVPVTCTTPYAKVRRIAWSNLPEYLACALK